VNGEPKAHPDPSTSKPNEGSCIRPDSLLTGLRARLRKVEAA
jgi:hypothetical protein